MKDPLISVVLPIYNTEMYLVEAIESILNQTFQNFELLAINDASTDKSLDIIKQYVKKDSRVVLINNNENLGLIRSLNNGIKLARGKYIARMDSDDISMPTRFEKQVKFLDNNIDVGIVGTWVNELGTKKVFRYPLQHQEIYEYLIYGSPFGHPAVMIRKEVLIYNDLFYSQEYKVGQDYDLWARLLKVTKGANIPEELLLWRKHKDQRSETNKNLKFNNSVQISNRIFKEKYPDDKLGGDYIQKLFVIPKEKNIKDVIDTINYFSKINKECDKDNDQYLYNKIAKKTYIYTRKNCHLGIKVYSNFMKSKWSSIAKKNRLSQYKFMLLSLKYSIKNIF